MFINNSLNTWAMIKSLRKKQETILGLTESVLHEDTYVLVS